MVSLTSSLNEHDPGASVLDWSLNANQFDKDGAHHITDCLQVSKYDSGIGSCASGVLSKSVRYTPPAHRPENASPREHHPLKTEAPSETHDHLVRRAPPPLRHP